MVFAVEAIILEIDQGIGQIGSGKRTLLRNLIV